MNTDRLFLGLLPILFLGSVSHAEEIHEVEPNNSIKTATPVKAEQDIILRLKSKSDVDYFRLTVPKPGPYKVDWKEVPLAHRSPANTSGAIQLKADWFDSAGNQLTSTMPFLAATKKGDYYLKVESHAASGKPIKMVIKDLTVFNPPKLIPLEPIPLPNLHPNAKAAKLDQDISFSLNSQEPTEFYFKAPERGQFRVKFLNVPKIHTRLRRGANGQDESQVNIDTHWAEAHKHTFYRRQGLSRTVKKGRVLYLSLKGYRQSPESIKIRVTFETEPLPGEPNDTIAQAQEWRAGQSVSFALTHESDTDWFQLTAPSSGLFQFQVLQKPDTDNGLRILTVRHAKTLIARHILASTSLTKDGRHDLLLPALKIGKGETLYIGFKARNASRKAFKISCQFTPKPFPGEPNDCIEQAQNLAIAEAVSFTLSAVNDQDYFRITAPALGRLKVHWLKRSKQQEATLSLTWYDKDNPNSPISGEEVACQPGQVFYLRLASRGHSPNPKQIPTSARFRIDFRGPGDLYEPNDHLDEAKDLPLKKAITLSLSPRYDTDFFRVTVPKSGILRCSVLDWNPAQQGEQKPYYRFFNSKNQLVEQGSPDIPVTKGQYYLQLTHPLASHPRYWKPGISEAPFKLTVSLDSLKDQSEPNDNFEKAIQGQFNEDIPLYFDFLNDVDVVSINVTEQSLISPRIPRFQKSETLLVSFYDQEKKYLGTNPRTLMSSKGRLYVKVRLNHAARSRPRAVNLRLRLQKDPDPHEPSNNSIATSPKMEIGQASKIWLGSKDDVDHFSFTLSQAQSIQLLVKAGGLESFLEFKVLDNSGNVVVSLKNNQHIYLPKAGRYALRIQSQSINPKLATVPSIIELKPSTMKSKRWTFRIRRKKN